MTLHFEETSEGLVPCETVTGHLIILDPQGRDSFVHGDCAKILTGWNRWIGYEQTGELTRKVGPYTFTWKAPYWIINLFDKPQTENK